MRTHYCGEVRETLVGQTVTVAGGVHRRRDHRGVIFVDLRDREGLLQIVVDPDTAEAFQLAERLGREYCIRDVILIATGPSPHHPPEIPFDGRLIFDSDTILNMQQIPRTMVVIGGGVIGTEYASIFTALGIHVTLIEPRGRIVSFVDSEIGGRLTSQLEKLGLHFVFDDRMTTIKLQDHHVHVGLEKGGLMEFDVALVAAGRQSNVQRLGLERVGIKLGERGLILVDENYQTNVSNIYAVGDVIGFPALASTSMEQARVAVAVRPAATP